MKPPPVPDHWPDFWPEQATHTPEIVARLSSANRQKAYRHIVKMASLRGRHRAFLVALAKAHKDGACYCHYEGYRCSIHAQNPSVDAPRMADPTPEEVENFGYSESTVGTPIS